MNISLQNFLARSASLRQVGSTGGSATPMKTASKGTARTGTTASDFETLLQSSSAAATTGPVRTAAGQTATVSTTPATALVTTPAGATTQAAATAPVTGATTTPATTATDTVAHLGPFTAGAISKPAQQAIADPAPTPTASYTALPASQQALLTQAWDPFNQAQHEATMNQWYMQTTQASNQQSLSLYQRAVADWKQNVAHCQDLGIAAPPPPAVPVLQAVGPMPDGYWFGKNSQG